MTILFDCLSQISGEISAAAAPPRHDLVRPASDVANTWYKFANSLEVKVKISDYLKKHSVSVLSQNANWNVDVTD